MIYEESKMTDLALKMIENQKWLDSNRESILEQYKGKFIAVHNKEVVDSDEKRKNLVSRLKKKYDEIFPSIIIEEVRKKVKYLL
jgi:hypothetical protein